LSRQLLWVALPPTIYLLAFCTAPLLLLALYSLFSVDFVAIVREPTLDNYRAVLGSPTYRFLVAKALGYGLLVALLTAIIAYPFALAVAKRVKTAKAAVLTLVLIPLYTGDLVRIFAWRVVLGAEGVVNSFLTWLGLIDEPLWFLLFSPFATLLVLTYNYLPFMILALWAAFEALDDNYLEAAQDLGAGRLALFVRVILPLTSPGLLAGGLMVMVLVAGDYLTPQLVGGSSGVTLTSAIHDLFGAAFDWPLAAALAWVLLTALAATVAAFAYAFSRHPVGRSLGAGS
jgi:spermidine/putrescine transport system permease protein